MRKEDKLWTLILSMLLRSWHKDTLNIRFCVSKNLHDSGILYTIIP